MSGSHAEREARVGGPVATSDSPLPRTPADPTNGFAVTVAELCDGMDSVSIAERAPIAQSAAPDITISIQLKCAEATQLPFGKKTLKLVVRADDKISDVCAMACEGFGLSDSLRPCSARLLHQGALLHGSTLEAHGLASGDRVKLVVPPRSQRTDVDSSEQATNTPDSAHTAHFSGQRRVQAALATDARGASQRKLETELAAAKHDAEGLRKALGRAEALRQALAEDLNCLREEVRALSAKRTTAAAEQLQQAGKEAAKLQATLQATQQDLSAARASAVSADALLWWTRHAAELTAKASAMLAASKTEAAVVKRVAPKVRCKVDREEERAVRAECRRERQRERAEKCQKRQEKGKGGHKPKFGEA